MASSINSGGLWVNARKFDASHPDYTGEINVDGNAVKIVAWLSKSSNPAAPYINIKVNDVVLSVPVVPKPLIINGIDKDDDIPF